MRNRLIFVAVAAGLLALYGLDHLFPNARLATKAGIGPSASFGFPARPTPAMAAVVNHQGSQAKISIDGTTDSEQKDFSISSSQQAVIRECLAKDLSLPRVHFEKALQLEDVVNDVAGNDLFETSAINIHVQKLNGEEVRLHVEPAAGPVPVSAYVIDRQQARVFAVDTDGLPVSLPFPAELRVDSMKQLISGFTSNGHISFRERRSQLKTGTLQVNRTETDGRVTELQLLFGNHSLGCAWKNQRLACDCI